MKPYREAFNDGFMVYGTTKTIRNNVRVSTGKSFLEAGKLAFKEMARKDSDFQLASSIGRYLNMKIKTPFPTSLRTQKLSSLRVRIGSYEYEVIHSDSDRFKTSLFWYLQEVNK